MQDPFNNLAETALLKLGFTANDVQTIKATKRVVFILDGLDELLVENIPPMGIIASNRLLEWPHAKVIFSFKRSFKKTLSQIPTRFQEHPFQCPCSQKQLHYCVLFKLHHAVASG
jgi:hypothetical protein